MTDTSPDSELSRSQRRRDAQAIFALARELVELPAGKFSGLDLEPSLREAIEKARRVKPRVARKRETQYVAKIMRSLDCDAIRHALDAAGEEQRAEAARQHRCEMWREKLLEDSNALTALCDLQPNLDIVRLRQLVRQCQKQQREQKPPTAYRQLFRLLREIDLQQPLPSAE